MNKEQILKRMGEISAELAKPEADVTALEAEYRQLQADLQKAELRTKLAAEINGNTTAAAKAVDTVPAENRTEQTEAEKRGTALKEKRAVTISAGSIITPAHASATIAPSFNEVSSIVDLINTEYMNGGESYKKAYNKGYGTGGSTAEGAAYTEADPTTGYAEIVKTKVTAYSEISEEAVKLPAANYDANVVSGVKIAIRKKLAAQIMNGTGASGQFKGIFHNPTKTEEQVINPTTDLELAEIDNKTLDNIIYSWGGDEDVEGDAHLILNKADLKAFAMLRDKNDRKVYDIKKKGNTGTINEVPFIINSACGSLTATGTTAGTYCMAYGNLKNYTVAVFADLEVARSTDYKFKEGMIAHKANVMSGGSVASYNGFIRIKKKAAG